jgi:5-methylcytosine-specific restriction endonuclease McrA
VRERRLERADYQCEFRGPSGVRCTARTRLEVDHIVPVGKGGSRGEENLRVFCRGHNLLAAEREFGEEFMRGKIEGRKRRAAVV